MAYSEGASKLDAPLQAGFLTYELSCNATAFPGYSQWLILKNRVWYHQRSVTPVAADFEYSKDWLVTDSYRLSYYRAICTCENVYTFFLTGNQE